MMNEEIITIKYKTNNKTLRLFGKQFVENNINNCKLIINNEEQELKEFLLINVHRQKKPKKKDEQNPGILKVKKNISKSDFTLINKKTKRYEEDDELEIQLIGAEKITDMSYMFSKCSSLISLDISNWKTSNIENMRFMFNHCNFSSLPNEISNIDTSKVNNMSSIFNKCGSLLTLPDISKWNTSNVRYMNSMFEECDSLLTLPDISKWDTRNVIDMSNIFSKCKSLQNMPDISKWNTSNVNNMSCMFFNCRSLAILPDLSKWENSNLNYKLYMFKGCISLVSLPDISKWKPSYFMKKETLFHNCINCINNRITRFNYVNY